jgi:hypothetical protein
MNIQNSNKVNAKINFLNLIIGIIISQKITIIGQIYIVEILSIIYLFFNFTKIKFNRIFKYLFIILIFHQLLVVSSDYINANSLPYFLKGFSSLPVFLITALVLYNYFQNRYLNYISFLIGFYLGNNFLNNFISEYNVFFYSNVWKWGVGLMVINIIFLYDEFKNKKTSFNYTIVVSLLLMGISLYYGTRALPLTIFYGILFFILTNKKNYLLFFNSRKNFFFLALIIFLTTFLMGLIPQKVDTLKYFKEITEKNIIQSSGRYGVVVAARSEWIAIYHATKDKPFLGHGSYPEDKDYYYSSKVANFLYDFGYINIIPDFDSLFKGKFKPFFTTFHQQIPTHSFFGYHIVSYGLGGSLIMLVLLYYITRLYLLNPQQLNFYFHFNFATFLYNFYFSPWGASHRVELMLFFVALLLKSEQILEKK